MEILNQYSSKARKKEKVMVLRFLRSSENRCIEGYCVSIHRVNTKTDEVIEGGLNIFGEGIYSKQLSHKFYKAVYNCVTSVQKYHNELRENNDIAPDFWTILEAELGSIWCPIDNSGVPGDIKSLDSIYDFIKEWDK